MKAADGGRVREKRMTGEQRGRRRKQLGSARPAANGWMRACVIVRVACRRVGRGGESRIKTTIRLDGELRQLHCGNVIRKYCFGLLLQPKSSPIAAISGPPASRIPISK